MKNNLIIVLVLISVVLQTRGNGSACANHDIDWSVKREEVRLLRVNLAKFGINEFITNSALPQIAPHIHSKYWVDRLPIVEIERRDYECEKREFGRDLVQQLEGCVFQDIRSMDTPTLEERSENLLLLAEWLSTSHGYGNYRLKRWAEHIALNGVVVLATRKEFAAAKIANYVARVAETDQNLPFRLDVLNEEAPHQFKLPVIRLGVDEGCLQAQWVAHLRETDRHYRELYKQGKIRRVSYCFSSVQHDDPVYAFYWDDCVGDATIGESWDKKRHYGFCVGDIDRDCKGDVKKVLRFREEVGVPLAPSSTECESQKAREAYRNRVEEMWREKTGCRTDLGAGDVILRVFSGTPLDLQSQAVLKRRLAIVTENRQRL